MSCKSRSLTSVFHLETVAPTHIASNPEAVELWFHHTFLSTIVNVFQDDHPRYEVLTKVAWYPYSGVCKFFIQPYLASTTRDNRFVYCELYTKSHYVIGYRVQIEDADEYLCLEKYDMWLEKINHYLSKLCKLDNMSPVDPEREREEKNYHMYNEALEKALQSFYNIWIYQNILASDPARDCCAVINSSLDEYTSKRCSLRWDDRRDKVIVTFKRSDKRKTTSGFDISFKWFADANITYMKYHI